MPRATATTARVLRRIVLGEDTQVNIENTNIHPDWYYVFIAFGFLFCTLSCALWFLCATYRLKQDKKKCTHSTFCEARIITETRRSDGGKEDVFVVDVAS